MVLLERPSSRALAALDAIGADVSFPDFACDSTLPAKDLAVLLESGLLRTLEAVCETFDEDFSFLAITFSFLCSIDDDAIYLA